MADSATNTTTNDNLLSTFFERRLIANLKEKTWFFQLATKFPLPKGEGKQITFNGWRKLAAASSTLGEGSSNSTVNLSSRSVSATIGQWGRAVKVTDLLELTSIAPPIQGAVQELSHAAALTLDNVIQRAVFKTTIAQLGQNADAKTKILSAWMSSTASSFSSDTGTDGNATQWGIPATFGTSAARLSAVNKSAPSISARMGPIAIRKAVNKLRSLAAEPMADGTYAAVAHPAALTTMYGNPDYKQWVVNFREGPAETMYKHETVNVHKVRFLESPNAPRYAVNCSGFVEESTSKNLVNSGKPSDGRAILIEAEKIISRNVQRLSRKGVGRKSEKRETHKGYDIVHPKAKALDKCTAHSVNITAILGKDAVGVTELDGGIKVFVKKPGPQSTNDPFNQNSTISFKLNAVAAVLNPSAGRTLFTHEFV